ncbi:hypothetical protein PsorP6_008723 [Peronosclerospora sorghi]|uniref:Uncharacterized protein n=1 Tax=Peronosclerospora sorghi TaxID=230839 RepID=A0ACC0VZD2_9STRA|nr:hypothetical protein PsorP6_008723 [Peronosclerospora sorghi]
MRTGGGLFRGLQGATSGAAVGEAVFFCREQFYTWRLSKGVQRYQSKYGEAPAIDHPTTALLVESQGPPQKLVFPYLLPKSIKISDEEIERRIVICMDELRKEMQEEVAILDTGIDTRAGAIGGETANTLEVLRNHPQFDALRQLVQSNPAALPEVIQQIGGQSPELLRLINQNQDRFVQMLKKPIGTRWVVSESSTAGAAPFDLVMGGGGAVPTPQLIQQLVDSLTPEKKGQMAAQIGMTPKQLHGLSQMLSNFPPGVMEQMMASMSGGGL